MKVSANSSIWINDLGFWSATANRRSRVEPAQAATTIMSS